MSELSGAFHDGSCSRFAAASISCIHIRNCIWFLVEETDLQSVSISGLSVEIHTIGTASFDCCASDNSMEYKRRIWICIPFGIRARMWGRLFLFGVVRYG
jgi:hypothetical protein